MAQKNGCCEAFKKQFVLGLVLTLPIVASVYVIVFLFTRIDNILGRFLPYRGMGFVGLILTIWLIGFIGQSKIGRSFVHILRSAILRTPIFGKLFKGFDEVGSMIISPEKKSFETVVIVEYPKKDSYALGFMTTTDSIKFKQKNTELVPVFLSTTPNPTSGYLLLFPKNKVYPVQVTVKEAMQTIMSMGLVHPKDYKPKKL